MRVEWSEVALDRVETIASHIALDDPGAATRWVVELFDQVDAQLSEFPESGPVVADLGAREVRELVFGAYLVFYRLGDFVEILTVRHGSQLLREEELRD